MTAGQTDETPIGDERGRKVAGSIKEAVGKITGDASAEREGAAEKAGGKPSAVDRP